jgi:large subunit ribosomal protein L47
MANHSLLRCANSSVFQLPPTFLAPTLLTFNRLQVSSFSTSSPYLYPKRDKSKNRNTSAIHRSGLRKKWPLSVLKEDLPIPVLDPEKHIKFEVNPDHGLWQFFNEKRTAMNTPEEDYAHGLFPMIEELNTSLQPNRTGLGY